MLRRYHGARTLSCRPWQVPSPTKPKNGPKVITFAGIKPD